MDFIDLKTQYAALREDINARIQRVLDHGQYVMGPEVKEMEDRLAAWTGAQHCIAVASGTEALLIALMALGIKPGDEVVTTPFTFVATGEMIVLLGAKPVFVDVEEETANIDVSKLAAAITPRTRALMPVHFAGLAADMDPINTLARARGLRVVEDAAHAIGTRYRGRLVGSFGDISCFSFHANKNMTMIEGGALSYADPSLRLPLERERFHGISKDAAGNVDVFGAGGKYNLTDVAAAVGLGQLRRLEQFNTRRRLLAQHYFARLAERVDPDILPAPGDEGHSWHLFALLVPLGRLGYTREEFIARMRARGIGIGVHYPSIPSLTYYRQLGWDPAAFPNAARIGAETVTLPLFPAMTGGDVDRVCDGLLELLQY